MNRILSSIVSVLFVSTSFFMEKPHYFALFFCLGVIFSAMTLMDFFLKEQIIYEPGLDRYHYRRIILAGPAGSGKDYLRDGFMEKGFPIDISYTTRPIREGETLGKTYNYITEDHFKHLKNNNRFYENVEFNGAMYGTLRTSWEDSLIFIMTPSGIQHITEEEREDCIIVYLDIDETVRRERMQKRSDGGFDKVERRILADNEDFLGFFNEADIIIKDPNFDRDEIIDLILDRASVSSDVFVQIVHDPKQVPF